MRLGAILLALLLSGCVSSSCARPIDSHGITGMEPSVEFQPPSIYRAWWNEMEECGEEEGNYSGVEWRLTVGEMHFEKETIVGLTFLPNAVIYIPAPYFYYKGIVTHEMLHVLLGTGGHPVPPFAVCAPLVAVLD